MNSEIICVAADSLPEEHSAFLTSYISKKLFELGHRTTFESYTAPDTARVSALLNQAFSRSDIIIILGGIEPETNSVAKMAVASLLKLPLIANEQALSSVKDYCLSIGAEPTTEQLSVSIVPEGAEVFKNSLGLCPGMLVEGDDKKFLLLPYAEGELTHMFESFVTHHLSPHGISSTHTVNVVGLTAEEIENKLSALKNRSEFAVLLEKQGAEYTVRISAVASTKAEAENICTKAVASVKFALGKYAYAIDSKGIQFEVVSLLSKKGLTVSSAESCTAGMVSEMLTDVGGSSAVFEYGISAYSNRIKNEILKVPAEILEKYSAISFETAKHMAINIRNIASSSLGIAITGNAGPTASEGQPVGKVFIAIADEKSYLVSELSLSEKLSRDEIREIASITALDLIRRYALSYPEPLSNMKAYSSELLKAVAATSVSDAEAKPVTAVKAKTAADNDAFINADKPLEQAPIEEKNSDFSPVILDRQLEDGFEEEIDEEYSFANNGEIAEKLRIFKVKLIGFFKSVFPCRADSKKKVFIKIGFLLSLFAFVTSAALIFFQLTTDNRERKIVEAAAQQWSFDGKKNENNSFTSFEPLQTVNEDIRGWLKVSGADVNNPVYQTTDNDFYLTHNMNKEKSRYGALFFDYRCSLDQTSPSQNLIIYGHEMKDGSMFGRLKKYKSLSFYKENPTITLTLLGEQSKYKIFSVMVLNATAADDNGYMYNYISPSFNNQNEFLGWANEAYTRSIIDTTVDIKADDEVITLVTCINDFDNARFVVMARKVRAGEDETVSVNNAVLNSNPRYPQAWYDKKGLEGYVSDEVSSITVSTTPSENQSTEIISSDITSSPNADTGAASSTPPVSSTASNTAVSSAATSSRTVSSLPSSSNTSSASVSSTAPSAPASSSAAAVASSNQTPSKASSSTATTPTSSVASTTQQ